MSEEESGDEHEPMSATASASASASASAPASAAVATTNARPASPTPRPRQRAMKRRASQTNKKRLALKSLEQAALHGSRRQSDEGPDLQRRRSSRFLDDSDEEGTEAERLAAASAAAAVFSAGEGGGVPALPPTPNLNRANDSGPDLHASVAGLQTTMKEMERELSGSKLFMMGDFADLDDPSNFDPADLDAAALAENLGRVTNTAEYDRAHTKHTTMMLHELADNDLLAATMGAAPEATPSASSSARGRLQGWMEQQHQQNLQRDFPSLSSDAPYPPVVPISSLSTSRVRQSRFDDDFDGNDNQNKAAGLANKIGQIGQIAANVGEKVTTSIVMAGGAVVEKAKSVRAGRFDDDDQGSHFSKDSSHFSTDPDPQRHRRRQWERELSAQGQQRQRRQQRHQQQNDTYSFSPSDPYGLSSEMVDSVPMAASRFRRPMLLCLAAVFVASVVVFAGMAFSNRGGAASNSNAELQSNVEPLSDDEEERLVSIRNLIVRSGATATDMVDGSVFPPTPQYRALMWLALNDPAELDLPVPDSSDEPTMTDDETYLLQRYALAVLWYATYGVATLAQQSEGLDTLHHTEHYWTDHTNWMTGRGICSWYGIMCHHQPGTDLEDGVVTYDGNNRVTHVQLPDNNIKGSIPSEVLALLSDVRHFDLSENAIGGTIPIELGTMAQLQFLYLYSNDITGRLPETIGELTELRELDVSDNSMAGPIPQEIGNLENLSLWGMFDNGFTGQIPTSVGNLAALEVMYLDSNQLMGTIPTEIFHLEKLYDLRLNKNSIGGAIPEGLEEENYAPMLELLYLDENELSGPIPSWLSKLNHLSSLRLFRNQLTGTLPRELGQLTYLDHLSADSNRLTGPIPAEWGRLSHLSELFLHGNQLTGSLPTQLGQLQDVRDLRFHDNRLTGSIPTEVGTMFRLESMSVQNNKLHGLLPTEIGTLEQLSTLRINGNVITGEVGPEVCELTHVNLLELASDCAGVSPDIECDCCTECF